MCPGLTHKYQTRLETFAFGKYSSLLCHNTSDEENSCIKLKPVGTLVNRAEKKGRHLMFFTNLG